MFTGKQNLSVPSLFFLLLWQDTNISYLIPVKDRKEIIVSFDEVEKSTNSGFVESLRNCDFCAFLVQGLQPIVSELKQGENNVLQMNTII